MTRTGLAILAVSGLVCAISCGGQALGGGARPREDSAGKGADSVAWEPRRAEAVGAADARSELSDRLRTLVDRYAGYGFSGVVAVSLSAESSPVVAAAGRRAGPDSPRMDDSTVFELGSLTKQLTAAAVLELEDRGLLATTDSLARWEPALPDPLGAITVHQLLLHTSGLPEDVDVPEDDVDAVWATLAGVDPELEPGSGWSYSNLGYVVLAAIVERTAPEGYRGVVEELIRRSGVPDIGFPSSRPGWRDRFAVGGSGPLGTGRITERWPILPHGWDRRLGASGAVATIPALIDWFRALHGGRVIPDEATRRMFAEHPPEIAYGWFYVRDGDGSVQIAHGGDTRGFQTYLSYDPAADRVLALGVNDRRGWRGPLLRDLGTIVAGDSMPTLPPPVARRPEGVADPAGSDALDELAGEYRLDDRSILEVEAEGERVRLSGSGPAALAVLTGADSALADRLQATSDSAATFLRLLMRGDTAAVDARMPSADRAESFWGIWSHLGAGHPDPPRSFRVLGTVPDRADRLVTFVELAFASGTEVLRLVWRPRLDGWGTGGDLPTRVFWPVGDRRLVSFDPTRPGWVELRWEETEGGRVLVDAFGRRAVR